MGFLPTPYTITHKSFQSGISGTPDDEDEGYGMGDTYAAPVTRAVYGWYPLSSQIPPGGDYSLRVVTSKVLMVPDVSVYSPRDRIALPGDDIDDDTTSYFVSQDVRDYNTGPFAFQPGGEVVLEKVTG